MATSQNINTCNTHANNNKHVNNTSDTTYVIPTVPCRIRHIIKAILLFPLSTLLYLVYPQSALDELDRLGINDMDNSNNNDNTIADNKG